MVAGRPRVRQRALLPERVCEVEKDADALGRRRSKRSLRCPSEETFRFPQSAKKRRQIQSPPVFRARQDRHPPARREKTRASGAFDRRQSNERRERADQGRPELFGLIAADRSKRRDVSCSLARSNVRAGFRFIAFLTDSRW